MLISESDETPIARQLFEETLDIHRSIKRKVEEIFARGGYKLPVITELRDGARAVQAGLIKVERYFSSDPRYAETVRENSEYFSRINGMNPDK